MLLLWVNWEIWKLYLSECNILDITFIADDITGLNSILNSLKLDSKSSIFHLDTVSGTLLSLRFYSIINIRITKKDWNLNKNKGKGYTYKFYSVYVCKCINQILCHESMCDISQRLKKVWCNGKICENILMRRHHSDTLVVF